VLALAMSEVSSEEVLLGGEYAVTRQRSEMNAWINTNQVQCMTSHDEDDLAIVVATVVTAVESEGENSTADTIHRVDSDEENVRVFPVVGEIKTTHAEEKGNRVTFQKSACSDVVYKQNNLLTSSKLRWDLYILRYIQVYIYIYIYIYIYQHHPLFDSYSKNSLYTCSPLEFLSRSAACSGVISLCGSANNS
jgi:hypothetical protein